MPRIVDAVGRTKGQVVQYCNSLFRFDDPRLVVASIGGVIEQPGRSFTHGFEIHLEGATVHFEYAATAAGSRGMPFSILTADGRVISPDMPNGNDAVAAFAAEVEEVVDSIRNNRQSRLLSGELASDAVRICHAQSKSIWAGEPTALREKGVRLDCQNRPSGASQN
jgi:hypothetical protein